MAIYWRLESFVFPQVCVLFANEPLSFANWLISNQMAMDEIDLLANWEIIQVKR